MTERAEAEKKLWELIKDINTCMLATWDGDVIRSRPMRGHQEAFDGELYFFTREESGKTHEIIAFDQVNLAYADPKNQSYVSVSGKASLSLDRELMKKYWTPAASAWFPKGLDDPDLALLKVEAQSAEYWDMTSSTVRYLFQVAVANIRRKEPDLGENEKLDLTKSS